MIFLSKRPHRNEHLSGKEACLSIIGLFLAIGLIGGLAGLIYGLIKSNSSATIAGGISFGIAVFLTVIFFLMIVFCLNTHQFDSKPNRHHQNGQKKHINTSHELPSISTGQTYDQTTGFNHQIIYPPLPLEFVDSSNYGSNKPIHHSPSQTAIFDSLNQSQSSTNALDFRQNYYN
ncbi:hypothetical protein I4U23_002725 [Adineta vaga]|nr:hypothetical protein I4U23_002725 [Adineta vaga]